MGIDETAACDGSVLVVPIGNIEQHGDHLPTATGPILVCAAVGGALDPEGVTILDGLADELSTVLTDAHERNRSVD